MQAGFYLIIYIPLVSILESYIAIGYQLGDIQPFNDDVLPTSRHNGQYIEWLGRIPKLETLMPPKRLQSLKTKLFIHTRMNQQYAVQPIAFEPEEEVAFGKAFHYDLRAMSESGFDPRKRTIVMIAGFLSGERVKWLEQAKELWLQLEDVNVILVGWSGGNKFIYSQAVADTPLVARQITIFLHYLAQLNGLELAHEAFASRIHIIGHSLGAHIAGFVGKDFSGRLGRITGLDPAGPNFDRMSPEQRLDRGDAWLVTIIHTNAGKMKYLKAIHGAIDGLLSNLPTTGRSISKIINIFNEDDDHKAWYGIDMKLGHLDYYANDGSLQPGCGKSLNICDHKRATQIYLDLLADELNRRVHPMTPAIGGLTNFRPMAFRANDYDDFLSGNSLYEHCPSILSERRADVALLDEELKRCSIPIDLVKPTEKLIEELIKDYNVDFRSGSLAENQPSYFFRTTSSKPFVGHHSLIVVRLNKMTTKWDPSCLLLSQIEYPQGDQLRAISSANIFESGNSYGLAVPFTIPWVKPPKEPTGGGWIWTRAQSLLLPREITLTLKEPIRQDDRSGHFCDLQVQSVELIPLFGKLYSMSDSSLEWDYITSI